MCKLFQNRAIYVRRVISEKGYQINQHNARPVTVSAQKESRNVTVWKVSVFGIFLFRIFPNSDQKSNRSLESKIYHSLIRQQLPFEKVIKKI